MAITANSTHAEQGAQLIRNKAAIDARQAADARRIDNSMLKRGANGSGAARADKILLAPKTIHDYAQDNDALRRMVRELQKL